VYETAEDLLALQRLLDSSIASASDHLTGIVGPGRRLTAEQTASVLIGMCTLSLATVTAAGEPRVSAVDGHFLRGRWLFTTSGTSVKARHLRARPQCSVSHLRAEDLGVWVHGRADLVSRPEDWVEEHLVAHYGSSPSSWGPDIVYGWVDPAWMVVFASDPAKLLDL
jgi:hypothetical protein